MAKKCNTCMYLHNAKRKQSLLLMKNLSHWTHVKSNQNILTELYTRNEYVVDCKENGLYSVILIS